jgi:hypothetical protein
VNDIVATVRRMAKPALAAGHLFDDRLALERYNVTLSFADGTTGMAFARWAVFVPTRGLVFVWR